MIRTNAAHCVAIPQPTLDTPASFGTQDSEGGKFSADVMKKTAFNLPLPTPTIFTLIQDIITILETIDDNREQCQALVDCLLQLLFVILLETRQATEKRPVIPPQFRNKMDRFQETLDGILEAVAKIRNMSNPKSKLDMLRAYFYSPDSSAAELAKCRDQLDWAIEEFDVISNLPDAISLYRVTGKVQQLRAQQKADGVPPWTKYVDKRLRARLTATETGYM